MGKLILIITLFLTSIVYATETKQYNFQNIPRLEKEVSERVQEVEDIQTIIFLNIYQAKMKRHF